ncbi:MAG: class I SAM-dependent methyltransferase [Chloroflexi bacterium]|nr:class I SAM-dependent methyltransferase [Chloroflexota bacterium]
MPPSQLAALRGEPSYVWRAGQERRLQMIARWAKLDGACVLDHGGGNGMYAAQIRQRYTPHVEVFDIESPRVREAQLAVPHALVAAAEFLPYRSHLFDTIVSNEVIEHVTSDRAAAAEIVRVLKPGGRAVIFAPNRWYPFETHGHYWRGQYQFGNTPLINYLPDALRNRLAPHVRAYTKHGLHRLFDGLPVTVVHHRRIYGGYDNIITRFGAPGRLVRNILHGFEGTPLDTFGLSHLLVIEKL